MSDITKQLEEIRIKKSIEYNKKLEEQKMKDDIKPEKALYEKEEKELTEHQEYLDKHTKSFNTNSEIIEHYDNNNKNLDESFIIINSIFNDKINVRELLNEFYQKLNHNNIYIFYISITEIIFNEITYDIIINILSLLDMDISFIDYLVETDKLNDVKIIFQEFIKIIERVKN